MSPPFSKWLRSLREAAEEPLRITAAAGEIDSTLLSKFERGERIPTETQAQALARHFHIEPKEMESRRIAAKILSDYGESAVLPQALERVQESTPPYRIEKIRTK